jgi:cytidylate kinase
MPIVTIHGQYGSGVTSVGNKLAKELGVDYVDRKIIAEVAQRLQRGERIIEEKESLPSTTIGRIAQALSISGMDYSLAYIPPEDLPVDDVHYLETLKSVVKGLAKNDSMVIHGRGSQFILRDKIEALHILLVAPEEIRIQNIAALENINIDAARLRINKFDGNFRSFIKRYFKAELEDPVHYDVVLNTHYFKEVDVVNLIIEALRIKGRSLS